MEGMEKQTAVEWLVNQLQEGRATFFKLNDKEERIITLAGKDVLEQAKEMEKEQMIELWNIAVTCESFEQYYKETYNSERIEQIKSE